LRCGDSLFGLWVKGGFAKAALIESTSAKKAKKGHTLFLDKPMNRAFHAASAMQIIEGLTDAEIAEARRSADVFAEVQDMTAPFSALLSFFHAVDWLELNTRGNKLLLQAFLSGVYGDPVQIALSKVDPLAKDYGSERARSEAKAFATMLARTRELIAEERFLHWQVTFPGVWSEWKSDVLTGGFDAIIGNPPWDKMKLHDVEWFAARRREIALAQRAADRKRRPPRPRLQGRGSRRVRCAYGEARWRYPQLSGGDVNIYSLFVERALKLVKPEGKIGLLTPSGIASDKTAAPFFKGISTSGRLIALFDFENKGDGRPLYFRDVHPQFKFCALIVSRAATDKAARCAFFFNDPSEIENPDRCFPLTAADFARLNPNTGTAPLFHDAVLTAAIYSRIPVLVNRAGDSEKKTWPVQYVRQFDMTNDSGLFRTRQELDEQERAYPIGGNRFKSAKGEWVPLYEGKMIWHFDHRAASVVINPLA
jgi:Eco57I restriction-modification methylase